MFVSKLGNLGDKIKQFICVAKHESMVAGCAGQQADGTRQFPDNANWPRLAQWLNQHYWPKFEDRHITPGESIQNSHPLTAGVLAP